MNNNYFEIARINMVKSQIMPVGVKKKDLLDSFYKIRRELFISGNDRDLIYSDSDIRFSSDRYFMRSFLMAKMFEYCNFSKEDKVLVIGCLTGYSVAILSNLVGYVFAIENDKKIVELANQTLSEMSLLNCSVYYKNRLSTGNSRNQPFDKIFIEGSVSHIPENLVKQLKEDGEIYTVIKNIDEPVGFFVRGLKIKNDVSFTKIFNTNVCNLNDFTEVGDDYAPNN